MQQNRWVKGFLNLLEPHSDKIEEQFRERAIRYFIMIALIFFGILFCLDVANFTSRQLLWYAVIFGICGSSLWALQHQNVALASRIMIFSLVLIVLDVSGAYWSPGTITLSLLFTFMFQMILGNKAEVYIAVALNLAVYTYLVFTSNASPFSPDDFYGKPHLALFTTVTAHFFIIGIAYYIRRDQAQRNQAELLVEKERVKILRQFIGNASHDLSTPITRLKTQIYLLGKRHPECSKNELQVLQEHLNELEMMVSGMLEMLRLDDSSSFQMEQLNLDRVLRDVISIYGDDAKAKAITLVYESIDENLHIKGESIYLRRAIGNILENAINYTPENGRVELGIVAKKQQIMITVQDTGIGIAESDLPHIFEQFYRADAARNQGTGGNGLGLAISKKIIELHDGKIQAESVLNKGSRFTISLPQ